MNIYDKYLLDTGARLAPGNAAWYISIDFTSVVMLTRAKVTTMLDLRTAVSTQPTGTVPIPPILWTF
jgi:hypothetical protein